MIKSSIMEDKSTQIAIISTISNIISAIPAKQAYLIDVIATDGSLSGYIGKTGKIALYIEYNQTKSSETIIKNITDNGANPKTIRIVDKEFKEVPAQVKNPPGFEGQAPVIAVFDFVADGIMSTSKAKFGDKTAEEWLKAITNDVIVTIVRVARGYRIPDVVDWKMMYFDFEGNDIFVCLPRNKLTSRQYNNFDNTRMKAPGPIEMWQEQHNPSGAVNLACQQEKSRLIVLPADDIDYLNKLRPFVFEFLSKSLDKTLSREQIISLVSAENMKTWARGFTHPSVSPDYRFNYELLELVGDVIMHRQFIEFLIDLPNNFSQGEISALKNHYLAHKALSEMAIKIGFDKFIVHLTPEEAMITHAREDVVESFFGAFVEVVDNTFNKKGFGDALAYFIVKYLFTKIVQINPEVAKGSVISLFVQMLQKIDWAEVYVFEGSISQGTIFMTPGYGASQFGFQEGKQIIIARMNGDNKKDLKLKIYTKAMDDLVSRGLTPKKAEEMKEQRFLNNPMIKHNMSRILDSVRHLGITSIQTEVIPVKDVSGAYLQLVGIKDNSRVTIHIQREPNSSLESWVHMMTTYLKC